MNRSHRRHIRKWKSNNLVFKKLRGIYLITESQGQGHQKEDDLDLVLDHEGLVIDVLDLGQEIGADILLGLDPKKDGIGKKKENGDRKGFLRSNLKLPVFVVLHSGWDSWTKGLLSRTLAVS